MYVFWYYSQVFKDCVCLDFQLNMIYDIVYVKVYDIDNSFETLMCMPLAKSEKQKK